MNRDNIIRMARESGAEVEQVGVFNYQPQYNILFCEDDLERFAALVAAAEREACARLCESIYTHGDRVKLWLGQAAYEIRKRGEK